MSDPLIGALFTLALAALFAWVLWWQRCDPAPGSRPRPEAPAFCAWCIYRDGDDCTNFASPVPGQKNATPSASGK
jgi:hypothetical protein